MTHLAAALSPFPVDKISWYRSVAAASYYLRRLLA